MTRSDADGTTKMERRQRALMIRYVVLFMVTLVCLIVGAFLLLRSFSTEQPAASLACAAKLYSPYDPKNLEQCMAVHRLQQWPQDHMFHVVHPEGRSLTTGRPVFRVPWNEPSAI